MKNTILFCMIICILTACTGQRTAQTTNRTNADSTGFGLNTRGINRSIPPPIHRNHPQGSVGMSAPDQIGTAAITELNQDEILKDLLPVKDNTRPTSSSISPLTDKQFITEAYALNLTQTNLAKQIDQEGHKNKAIALILKNGDNTSTRLKQLAQQNGIELITNSSTIKEDRDQQITQVIKEKIALYERASVLENTLIADFAKEQIPLLKQQLAEWLRND